MKRLLRWAVTLSGLAFAWFSLAVLQDGEENPNTRGAMLLGIIWVWGVNAIWTDVEGFIARRRRRIALNGPGSGGLPPRLPARQGRLSGP